MKREWIVLSSRIDDIKSEESEEDVWWTLVNKVDLQTRSV